MDNTRIEILKDGIYVELKLGDSKEIRYNSVINKIGKTNSREISGSNTFSIPWIHHNIQTLGLNQFNMTTLASSLNQKYEAKYYNEDVLFQTGFVIINNMDNGVININFIDKALSITEKWGSTNYKELLNDPLLSIPTAYKTAIDEMVGYTMNKTGVLPHLTNVSGETFPIALFPNNLNQIGDKWQIFADDTDHMENGINPYQSRPIFNTKAFITLACEAYGYSPVFHDSIDWDIVAKSYMTTEGLDKNQFDNGGITTVNHTNVSHTNAHFGVLTGGFFFISQVGFEFDLLSGIAPNTIANLPTPPLGVNINSPQWYTKRSIFVPDVSQGNVGIMTFTATYLVNSNVTIYALYQNTTGGAPISELVKSEAQTSSISITLNKSVFDTPTSTDAGTVIGVYVLTGMTGPSSVPGLDNMQVSEEYLPEGLVSYDEYGQFLQDSVDLTYAAPLDSISALMSGLMQKDGILMNIDSTEKEIEFFSYKAYETRRDLGGDNIVDWSKYLLEEDNPRFNTNYGNNYAISNQIGLTDPYPGNIYKVVLGNQTSSSKYKDFSTDYVGKFSDIKSVKAIAFSTVPYTEYSTDGASLVQYDTDLGNLIQYRYDKTTQGNIANLPALYNINYGTPPTGVVAWYNLIDNAVRARPSFLLPIEQIRNLDLRKPIFVDQLNGYYIPEEVEQYVNSQTKVSVKLMKIDSPVIYPTPVESITLNSSVLAPNAFVPTFVYEMINKATFSYYEPTSATVKAKRLSGSIASGGTATGFEYNGSLSLSTFTNNQIVFSSSIPITSGESGYYSVQVTDNAGAVSNVEEVFFGAQTITEYITISKTLGIGDIFNTQGAFTIDGFTGITPSNTTYTLVEVDVATGLPLNSGTTTSIANAVGSFTVSFPTAGSWAIYVTSDGYVSNSLNWIRIL